MSFLVFLFWLSILVAEGFMGTSAILRKRADTLLTLCFALSLGSLLNVLLVFLYTVTHLPLTFTSFLIGHSALIAFLFLVRARIAKRGDILPVEEDVHMPLTKTRLTLRIVCGILLSLQLFFSFAHAVVLPTYHIDSLTNWTMRSKVSFYDHAIAFDSTEARGVAKPQYPFLFHSLQMVVNEGNTEWSDRTANAVTFLLTVSAFAALFFMIQKKKNTDMALLAITCIAGIPLLSFHLSQGYGDLPLALFLCLSFVCLWVWKKESDAKWLLLSGLMMTAAVWTKSEGMIVGFVPWVLLVAVDFFNHDSRRVLRLPAITSFLLSILFPVFLLSRGMGLTPHSSDTRLEWHPEVLGTVFSGLFASGSMGVTFTVLALGFLLLLWMILRKDERIDRRMLVLGLWGLFALAVIAGTYLFTPNAVFLANGESFYRQLKIPASLLTLFFCVVWEKKPAQE